jgi:hypothetical protein
VEAETSYEVKVVMTLKDNSMKESKLVIATTLPEGAADRVKQPLVYDVDKTSFRITWRGLNDEGITAYKVEWDEGTRGTVWKEITG